MKMTFDLLRKWLPELNRRIISVERIIHVSYQRLIEFYEIPLHPEDNGAFVSKDGKDYIFIRYAMRQLLRHETVLHEGCHGLIHAKNPALLWRQQLEADVFALVGMMPLPDLPRLNRIKHSLEPETYELLLRRNRAHEVWKL